MLLIGQAFYSILYYRRQNILYTPIANPSNVKDILNVPDFKCLFGDRFEEKLVKDTNAKQKSKFVFSKPQRKS